MSAANQFYSLATYCDRQAQPVWHRHVGRRHSGHPGVLLLASGSEVALCIAAYEQLTAEGVQARVSVEAASPLGWDRYVGRHGTIIAMRSFGLSAPGKVVQAHFGFDVAHVLEAARQQMARNQAGV